MNKSIQIASDLHLEFDDDLEIDFTNYIKKSADWLFLAGDICTMDHKQKYISLLNYCSGLYEKVFIITGKHEYYQLKDTKSMNDIDIEIENICDKYDNIYFLQKGIYEDDDIVILGCTLWSNVSLEKYYMSKISDYFYIYTDDCENVRIKDTLKIHNDHREWLEGTLGKYKKKNVIVMTHHMPSFKLVDKKYGNSDLNDFFYSNLDHIFQYNPNIKLWIAGHTHTSFDIVINKSRVIVNPHGYNDENDSYDNSLKIDI